MEFLDEIENNTLLIVENDLKTKVLEYIDSLNKLVNLKIMTKEEFLNHYFYDYNEETIYYVVKKYHTSPNNAKIYLENMKYVLNLDVNDAKIVFLKNLYQDLKEKNLLIFDDFFQDYLKHIEIKVLLTTRLEPFYQEIFNNYQVNYVQIKKRTITKAPLICHFKTIDEEITYVFNQIASLIKKGVSREKIKIVNLGKEYLPYLKRMSKFYNLKINNLESYPIMGTVTSSMLLKKISSSSRDLLLNLINKNLDNDIYSKFFAVLNRYYFLDDLKEGLSLITEDLKSLTLKSPIYQNALTIIPLNSYLIADDDYVFVLGFNLENIPKTYKDTDFLTDDLKTLGGLFTSLNKNKLEKELTLFHLKNIPNLTITYKDNDPYQSYYPSNLLEEIGEVFENSDSLNVTSNLYNQILLTSKLDDLLKFGEKKPYLNLLLNTYPNLPYLTYNNKFKGINETFANITLSYTSLNNFYHCQFRYYIENILKLNIYDDSFKIYIGNLFHFVLSKMFDEDFSFNHTYQEFIKYKKFTKKEQFYLEILKEELQEIIEIINHQHRLSALKKVKLETDLTLPFSDSYFKGIIDKIMYLEKDNKTYLSLIDYKTGIPKADMTNLIYGIDMQLPIYLYLIKKSNIFLNPQIIGFYFQQIIHEKPNYEINKTLFDHKKDKLKLIGYTVNDRYLVNLFDESYENSELIKGMKTTNKGFAHYTKVISQSALLKLVEIVDLKIKEAFREIKKANFTINPKVIGGENLGCQFCPYQDLCFKTGADLVYLEKKADLSYLEEGDQNA